MTQLVYANPEYETNEVDHLSKVEKMDTLLTERTKVSGKVIREIVDNLFAIHLEKVVSPQKEDYPAYLMNVIENGSSVGNIYAVSDLSKTEIMDLFLEVNQDLTGSEIRKVINDIYGVNLDGISLLANARISLFSKGQWILKNDYDLLTVFTDVGDGLVEIYPTAYFTEQMGRFGLPELIQEALAELGFMYDEETGKSSYTTAMGEPVADSFKGQTMGLVVTLLQKHYAHLF
ncbi:hypothetical protein [Ectobacillus sp. sgz5001026]|uniref:hypothetical protein n=1 Tax=Ectobacillus sp. sgz5001026 TaxID=3242473 RepID=UPI0036D24084